MLKTLKRTLRAIVYAIKTKGALVEIQQEYRQMSLSDQNKADLAAGRWLRYQNLRLPQFHIALDKNAEAVLDRHTALLVDPKIQGPLTPTQQLKATELKIQICEDCFTHNMTLYQYLDKESKKNILPLHKKA